MTLLVATHPRFLDHDTGRGHPERPARLGAVQQGIDDLELGDTLVPVEPAPAPRAAVERVHPAELIDAIARFAAMGGGPLDPDTHVSTDSFDAAMLAAG